ncbi:hypothetical protein [Rhizobium sp.]
MTNIDITRRAMLGGLAASAVPGAAVAVPAVEPECPYERVRRLSSELSDAMNDYQNGKWQAIIMPSKYTEYSICFGVIHRHQHPETRLRMAIANAKEALRDLTGKEPFDASIIGDRHNVVAVGVLPDYQTELRWFYDSDEPLLPGHWRRSARA